MIICTVGVFVSPRLQAENVGWDVAAVLSMNRERFASKGPLEVSSELLIQHASRGELQAVSHIRKTDSVHPDVADSQGHTALLSATVTNYHILVFVVSVVQTTCTQNIIIIVKHVCLCPGKLPK